MSDDGAGPAWSVRPAEAGDLDAVHALEVRAFGDPWSRRSFGELLVHPAVAFRVATVPGAGVVGYVVAWFVVDEAEIANLAVAPDLRGRGIGAALLDLALVEATAHGCATMYLEVRDSNGPARALYASRGFEQVGRRRGYYRHPVEDALVLRRTLACGATRVGS